MIIKLHPRESFEKFSALASANNNRITIVKDINLNDLIASSDLFLSRTSSTLELALALGKPLIAINSVPDEIKYYFKERFGTLLVDHLEGLQNAFDRVFNDPGFSQEFEAERERYINQFMVFDGSSMPRIKALIYGLLAVR